MIPKIIHYCWFGGKPKSDDVISYIKTWEKNLPDYRIVEWNESNFDISSSNTYVRQAYEAKKWAFVSDYVRLTALYRYGGIYFDTDVEVFKSFDCLLDSKAFFGFETKDYVATAVMGCELENELIGTFLKSYDKRSFIKPDGSFDMQVNVKVLTGLLLKGGLKQNGKKQILSDGCVVYPQYYFSSNDFINVFGKYRSDIFAFHHCLASWYNTPKKQTKQTLFRHYVALKLRNILGTDRLESFVNKQG